MPTLSPTAIRVLAFDVFGTVVDWRSSVIAEGEELGKSKGFNVDWAAFADAWRGVYRPNLNRVLNGELPWTKLDELHRMSLMEMIKRFKIESLSEEEINRGPIRFRDFND
jgi:2-haloacid dehalogenase